MSTTTVTHTQNGDFHSSILRDYELHHSQDREESPDCRTSPVTSAEHPEFDLPHRRVPEYRPLNRDAAHVNGVRVYTSTAERFFITAMFRGLSVNASAAQYWRASIGRFTDKVWKYQVGGEF
ncbi:hypothetical protein RAB80_012512 [Fusarium oxysporum f. sp. vasinfectum]|uniref:Uncharacterized protein n=1 Tax=Fusarium oxysporum f. sp. vasinfectum 25433 TaxID=1089449 RepID=X0M077_FUSOX|nr:hypothetical protein FOTG_04225 [Fusarium oxysporum f. sp. vasinfectum 25433]KAK2672433.1 hypothetical protein RAB80_012512 [Fusarium oxysporum f. sp. vasinfectum]KAK2928301.1 hypothetical protein FoTM2_011163 [Fusarium oxysporum f. sp. vasinfectum]